MKAILLTAALALSAVTAWSQGMQDFNLANPDSVKPVQTGQRSAPGAQQNVHMVAETVSQFAESEGLDLSSCRLLKFSPRGVQPEYVLEVDPQTGKLRDDVGTCRILLNAEKGGSYKIGVDGRWQAVFDGGKLVSFDYGHAFDPSKLLAPSQLPPISPSAYEVKDDQIGMGLGEYLRLHPNDCVTQALSPKPAQYVLIPLPQDPTAFDWHCYNAQVTLANVPARQMVYFSEQRLYLIYYSFDHSDFDHVERSLIEKFGPSSSPVAEEEVQNGFGAHFKRRTVTWVNGVSTIRLEEMGSDLATSGVAFTLDSVYNEILKRAKPTKKDL